MPANKKSTPSEKKSISINGDVRDSNVFIGDNNIFKKIVNYIFPSEIETLEQRNRRILLNHVENAWIKGVLDASLHGAALLELGIKQDPKAVTQYPWAIKKESTNETLPARTSMLEIFDSIGMGRSLLILGAPGSGKTTMLLELARGLIARAREDATQSIPMVFNLASWTEKLTIADWLAQELNNLYSVPRKTAPDWVKGNKLLLLLDGLDEVRQESRAKCVEAINTFRKEEVEDPTFMVVCSRSQDYADLNAKLSFEGAIEVQPLTQEQIAKFINRFGDEMEGIKQVLEKDNSLREMAETPLFLSIMIMAYRNKRDVDIRVSKDEKAQHKHLFNKYIERMFERPRRKNETLENQDVLRWLSWLARKMNDHNQVPYLIECMQPDWLTEKKLIQLYRLMVGSVQGLIIGSIFGMMYELIGGVIFGRFIGLLIWLILTGYVFKVGPNPIRTVDALIWSWKENIRFILFVGLFLGLVFGLVGWISEQNVLISGLFGIIMGLFLGIYSGLTTKQVDQTTRVGQSILFSLKNFLLILIFSGLFGWLMFGLMRSLSNGLIGGLSKGLMWGLFFGFFWGLPYGGDAIINHYILRFVMNKNNLLPWRIVPFLDHCVDLIFLRRVGGGYIFVHRLLMEHFAEMYVENR